MGLLDEVIIISSDDEAPSQPRRSKRLRTSMSCCLSAQPPALPVVYLHGISWVTYCAYQSSSQQCTLRSFRNRLQAQHSPSLQLPGGAAGGGVREFGRLEGNEQG